MEKGRTKGIFQSWNLCEKSVNKFRGQVYKGFNTLDEAINFLHPSYSCLTVPIYDDHGHISSAQSLGHTCDRCVDTELRELPQMNNDNVINTDTDMTDSESEYFDTETEMDKTVIYNPSQPIRTIDTEETSTKEVVNLNSNFCNVCHSPEDENMIMCDTCASWTHYVCTGLIAIIYDLYS